MSVESEREDVERSDCGVEEGEEEEEGEQLPPFSSANLTSAATKWKENEAGSSCGMTLSSEERGAEVGEHVGKRKKKKDELKDRVEEAEVEVDGEKKPVSVLPALTAPATSRKMKANFIKVLSTTEDEEELFNSWKLLTKTKGVLNNGARLENASWRRWFQKRYNIPQVPASQQQQQQRSLDLEDSDTDSMESTDMADPASSPSTFHNILKTRSLRKDGLTSDLIGGRSPTLNDALDLERDDQRGKTSSQKRKPKKASCLKAFPASPDGLKKAGKRVSFHEDLNQMAFVSYEEDKWDDSAQEMLINVDELSRMRHSSAHVNPPNRATDLGSLINMKISHHPSTTSPEANASASVMADIDFPPVPVSPHWISPSRPAKKAKTPWEEFELMGEERKLAEPASGEDDEVEVDLDDLSVIGLIFELMIFLRWCAGMAFISPGAVSLGILEREEWSENETVNE